MKFFYWEPTAANKPTIYLATESRGGRWGGGEARGEWEEGRGRRRGLGFFSSCFILQKGCNQLSWEGWYRVSHKTVQWPRKRGQATSKVSACSCLLEVGQSPHCTSGHCWEAQAEPPASLCFIRPSPPWSSSRPCRPMPSSPRLASLSRASFHLSARRSQAGAGEAPTSAR